MAAVAVPPALKLIVLHNWYAGYRYMLGWLTRSWMTKGNSLSSILQAPKWALSIRAGLCLHSVSQHLVLQLRGSKILQNGIVSLCRYIVPGLGDARDCSVGTWLPGPVVVVHACINIPCILLLQGLFVDIPQTHFCQTTDLMIPPIFRNQVAQSSDMSSKFCANSKCNCRVQFGSSLL